MQVLIERKELFTFNWHPGCVKSGFKKYSTGPIGRQGAAGESGIERVIPKSEPTIPQCLLLIIGFKDCTTAFRTATDILEDIEKDDVVCTYNAPQSTFQKVGIRPEFESKAHEIEARNKDIQKRWDDVVDEMSKLADGEFSGFGPALETIPDEFFIFKQVWTCNGEIKVACDSQSRIYQLLKEAGILEESFPEWYKTFF